MSNILPFPPHRARLAAERIHARQCGRKLFEWRAEVIAAWDAREIDATRAARLLATINRQRARLGLTGSAAQ